MPPLPQEDARELIGLRHHEWAKYSDGPNSWKWFLDSLEGGDAYRHAVYGAETYRLTYPVSNRDGRPVADVGYLDPDDWRTVSRSETLPRRNLIRHRREYPTPERPYSGSDEFTSTDDEYELRLARTPVPGFVPEAVGIHLGRIYAREVRREAPDGHPIREWWADVDGRGSSIDDWMQGTIAPILSVLGQLDLVFDHPPAPDGEEVRTRADVARLGLGKCVAGYILPENLVWWRLLPNGRYAECLVVESWGPNGPARVRHWTAVDSVLYTEDGEVVSVTPHPFRRCPVVRVFDQRKARCGNVGQSRYEPLCEIQREYYNVDSESVLSNTLQAHPLLSGPEDFMSGTAITVGPNYGLPKKKSANGDRYEGWEYVSPSSEPSDKLERKLDKLRAEADRAACLTRPPGASGTSQPTVAQSGISKIIDEAKGNDWLIKQASMLERAEDVAAEYVLTVMADGRPDRGDLDAVAISYPREFDLRTASDLAALAIDFQAIGSGAGDLPTTEGHFLKGLARLSLPGKSDEEYDEIDREIDEFLAEKTRLKDQQREAGASLAAASPGGPAGGDGADAAGGDDGIDQDKMVRQGAMRSLMRNDE